MEILNVPMKTKNFGICGLNTSLNNSKIINKIYITEKLLLFHETYDYVQFHLHKYEGYSLYMYTWSILDRILATK